jgi:hypothetical protein
MSIIVEGPDGAGKTSLAFKIQEFTGFPIAPRLVSSGAQIMDKDAYHDAVKVRFFNDIVQHAVIFDRLEVVSSPCYSMLKDPTWEYWSGQQRWVQECLSNIKTSNSIVIACMPPLEVVRANVKKDETSQVVRKHIDGIYYAYENWFSMWKMINPSGHLIHWDYTQYTTAGMMEQLVRKYLRWSRT